MYVLIILAGVYGGAAPAMHDFATEQACAEAMRWVMSQTRNTTRAACMPKASPSAADAVRPMNGGRG